MYSVYMVDDEQLVLKHMGQSVAWDEYNLRLVGMQTDPVMAVEDILREKPDVVLTDMKMACMSGLQLIATLKEKGCTAEFIVLSAYDHFEYVRQAMVLEGFDYLIKPVEQWQLAETFARLTLKLDEKHGKHEKPETMSQELNQIIKYLGEHFAEHQSLQQIAHQFSINPHYICRLFSKHLDTTFSTYLAKLRLDHAAKLLTTTAKPIKEVTALCGYDDYFYFCRVFREAYGCTPTQYRSNA